MTEPEDLDDRIARLREASAELVPSAALVERVVTSASTLRSRSWIVTLGRAWWSVPIAAAAAAGAVSWMIAVHGQRTDAEAAREMRLVLGVQEEGRW